MLVAGQQRPADPVERVVLVAAAVQGVLLDPAADLVDDLGPELHDMEGVEDRDRVGQLVADRVGVAAERPASLVELRGFEPLTFSLRTRRATNCATAPCALEREGKVTTGRA